MTNKNSPSVMSVTGIVSTTRIGRTSMFSRPMTSAAIMAVPKLATLTPP